MRTLPNHTVKPTNVEFYGLKSLFDIENRGHYELTIGKQITEIVIPDEEDNIQFPLVEVLYKSGTREMFFGIPFSIQFEKR